MRLVNSRVESIGPDEQDPSSLAIRLDSSSGLANPSLKIARDQMEGFLAILGVEREEDLIGRSVRVTVDDEKGSEQIAFLTPAEQAQAGEPIAGPAPSTPPQPIAAAGPAEPDRATPGTPVMAAPAAADEITVYDGVGQGRTLPAAPAECVESAASLTPAEQVIEDQARADLAAAATAPLERRYFLYRETYDRVPRPSVVELTSEEFALLGGSGAYLHVDDCTVIGAQGLSPETAQGIERLLERATSRPEAGLPRAELERLAAAGHVVSCAVY